MVPVHYLSFVKTVSRDFDHTTDLHKIFQFDDARAITLLSAFISAEKMGTEYAVQGDPLPDVRRQVMDMDLTGNGNEGIGREG